MFGKKFFSTVALGGTAVGLVGNSGQIFAEDFRNSAEEKEEKVANLQKFVDWLDVSKSEFEGLCDGAKVVLNIDEQVGRIREKVIFFTTSHIGRVRDPDVDNWLSSRNDKILAVSGWNDFLGSNYFKFYKKGSSDNWYLYFYVVKNYLQELKNDPSLLESINFKK